MNLDRGNHTYQEILSQAESWKATLQGLETRAQTTIDLLNRPFAEAVFTGCGSTHYLALAAAATWQAMTGMPARGVPASELWLFPGNVLSGRETLLVAISRSGETTETLNAVRVFKDRHSSPLVVVSVYPDRALGQTTPYQLVACQAEEHSIAQTRSFTSMFVLAQAAACLAAGQERAFQDLKALPARFPALLQRYEALSQALGADFSLERFVFLGSGANYGLACEAMLKMKEMSLSPSEAFHFMEFRHGPKSVVAPGTLVIGLLSDTACAEEIKVLAEMRALGAKVLALVENNEDVPADYVVELHSGVPELHRSVLFLPVLQLLAFYRSYEKGLDPDRPNNLDAVVRL